MKTRVKKPEKPDCNSCYHFFKTCDNAVEGYCKNRKSYHNAQEGKECEQFEPFSLYCGTDEKTVFL